MNREHWKHINLGAFPGKACHQCRQLKQRIAADDSRQLEKILYPGGYERELHMTKASASAPPVVLLDGELFQKTRKFAAISPEIKVPSA